MMAFAIVLTLTTVCLGQPNANQTGQFSERRNSNVQPADELPELKQYASGMRPPVESLRAGESHSYRVSLDANQYLRIQGYFYGLDGSMVLYNPGGEKLEEVSLPTSTDVQKSLMWTCKVAGVYRFEVRALSVPDVTGKYQVAAHIFDGKPENEDLIAADEAHFEGVRLSDVGTENALREAIERFQVAIPHWRALADLESRYMEYQALMYLGEAYFKLSEYDNSLRPYQQALALRQTPGWKWHEVWASNNVARSYEMLGDVDQALKYFQMSVRDAEHADDNGREFAVACTALGGFYLSQGEKQKALEYLYKAMPHWITNNLGTADMPDVDGRARVWLRLGQLNASLGETDEAVKYLSQAAVAWRTTNDPVWLVRALNSLGEVQFDLGDFQGALTSFKEGLEISKKSGNRENEGYALANVGQVKLSLGSYQEALDCLKQALSIMESIGNRGGQAYVLSKLGLVARARHDSREAIEYFDHALQLRESIIDREGTADALYQLAVTQRDLGELEVAQGNIKRALGLIEFVRSSFSGQEMRSAYLSNTRSYYEFNIDLLMRLHERNPSAGYDANAFEASEQARARNLLEALFTTGVDIREGVPGDLLQRERAIEQRLKAKSESQTRLLSGSHTSKQATEAAREVSTLTDEYRETQARIRAASPRYAALTQPQPLVLKEIQSQALDPDTVLLEYSLGEERSFLWVVTQDSISAFRLPKRAEIENLARRFYLNVGSPKADATEIYDTAPALSRILFGQVINRLEHKRLLIVAEGALQYVPFAALPIPKANGTQATNDRSVFAAQHEIVSLPSASSLVFLRREIGSRSSAPKTMAVLADPVFENGDPRVRHNIGVSEVSALVKNERATNEGTRTLTALSFDFSLRDSGTTTNGIIPRLPSTRREALAIGNLVSPQQRKLALDFDASRATVLSGTLGQYRILHFATHGLLDSQRPELSGLVLSLVDKNGRPEDGFLQVHEIYNLKLPADLVVLSACRTALGKDVRGEGLLGVTRGFMYAGAARIVSSLWEVDSRATAELMTRFYRETLTNKLSAAAALRAAQLSMSKDPRWHSPYYWAGFIIQGEYR
jgi:CHAT domain-containing protein/Tfp pilus assembly protein PilF